MMNTGHSSLCADTGLSEIQLDRMGISPVKRIGTIVVQQGKDVDDNLSGTALGPFDNGLKWYDDDDIKRNRDLLDKERKYGKDK